MSTCTLVPRRAVAETIHFLQEAGERHSECVVLWLGRRIGERIQVEKVVRPMQQCRVDQFIIPPLSMATLMRELQSSRLMIAAQVHSHPMDAFHSEADDRWAIVRHVGALSLVLPFFAREVTCESFLEEAAVFQLDARDNWLQSHPDGILRIIP